MTAPKTDPKSNDTQTGMDAPTEADSGRDGVLSYAAEWHAFSIGFYEGLKDLKPDGMERAAVENRDVQKEPHYARGGYVIGSLLKLVAVFVLGDMAGGLQGVVRLLGV